MTRTERKRPGQARAQETVRAILEATVQLLDREGVDAATTTRIAEVARVSVGSLYQYFSHRDAILNALQSASHFLAATTAPILRRNVDAAAFPVYQSVRATMLAYLLERPPGLGPPSLIEELTNLITGYLLGPDPPEPIAKTAKRAVKRK